jgi:hypothetical protein
MYIDPNTGGLLFQILAVSFAVLSGLALAFSRQIRLAFTKARRFLRELISGEELKAKSEDKEPSDEGT